MSAKSSLALAGLVLATTLAAAQPPETAVSPTVESAFAVMTGLIPCDAGCAPNSCNWVWFEAEFLNWWTKRMPLPPVVGAAAAEFADFDTIPESAIHVLFSERQLGNEDSQGGRFTFGFWTDPHQCLGFEARHFWLAEWSAQFDSANNFEPIMGPLFVADDTGLLTLLPFRYPGSDAQGLPPLSGTFHAAVQQEFGGTELNALFRLQTLYSNRNHCVAGIRYLHLDENLELEGTRLDDQNNIHTEYFDRFRATNHFIGPQIGLRSDFHWGPWSVNFVYKLAVGLNHQKVNINGQTVIVTEFSTDVFDGGVLAQPTNIGHHDKNRLAVVPEFGVKIGYDITRWMRASLGYDFLWISSVVRPGDQIDSVQRSQIPSHPEFNPFEPATRPAALMRDSNFWAQGLNLGLEFTY